MDVLVVGAGPVGLTLASELARHDCRCRIIDRLPQPLGYCRAIGVTPRTLEVWDDMGIARDMIDAGLWLQGMRSIINGRSVGDSDLSLPELPYAELGVPQNETERILTEHLHHLGVEVERGVTLTTLSQRENEVAVQLTDSSGGTREESFRYVIGCDGAHSAVRHALGIPFEGDAFPMMFMLGDVHVSWDLPYGMSLRALRLVEDGAPQMFIAIPLPERGRYRVSALAPNELAPASNGGEHGIQSEMRGPSAEILQGVADELLPEKAMVSDLRWSSLFRISMRLAKQYRQGRVFIAGDAAHIHPPTGGQGMNTGIQDTYNLAWKLALVLRGVAPESLLDSYEAERRPVGADVVARTVAASVNYGREPGGKLDRLADTQIRVSYRGTEWVRDDAREHTGPAAGDRAPDADGMRRHGFGFSLHLFDVLRGPQHVLLAHLQADAARESVAEIADLAREMHAQLGSLVRVAVVADGEPLPEQPHLTLLQDCEGAFSRAYGPPEGAFLVRPDGYVGWRGRSWRDPGMREYLKRVFALVCRS